MATVSSGIICRLPAHAALCVPAAALLTSMSEDDASVALQVAVEGRVEVEGPAIAMPTSTGLKPVRCPERKACLEGGGCNLVGRCPKPSPP